MTKKLYTKVVYLYRLMNLISNQRREISVAHIQSTHSSYCNLILLQKLLQTILFDCAHERVMVGVLHIVRQKNVSQRLARRNQRRTL
jgi:hypothetical protein